MRSLFEAICWLAGCAATGFAYAVGIGCGILVLLPLVDDIINFAGRVLP